jgi:WD40 repeat protein
LVAFSPDGHTLATGSDDGSARLWNVSDPNRPTPLGRPLTDRTDRVSLVAFSPDGHTLATGSDDGTHYGSVRLWVMDVDRNIERICTITKNTLTRTEWQRYVGDDVPYDPPCA